MLTIFLDAETYYNKDYSLRNMTIPEYVRDPRFQVLGWSVAVSDGPIYWYGGNALPNLPWHKARVVAHNMLFDGFILVEHYGIQAMQWCCTQSMLRGVTPLRSVALKNVAQYVDVGAKGDGLTEGGTGSDQSLIDYAIQDTAICRALYRWLESAIPEDEFLVIHYTLRWGIDATLTVDIDAMEHAAELAEQSKDAAVLLAHDKFSSDEIELTEAVLTSNQQFAQWFADEGLTPPMKISPTTGIEMPAFAKGDPEWQAYKVSDEGIAYSPVWKARELAKSNIGINRPRKMARIARACKNHTIPMPLKYYGAHTGRWSGTDGYNVQNLPNGSVARTAIEAPAGHVIVVADSSQIELRLNAWFSGEQYILDTLSKGEDMYIKAAALHHQVPYNSIPKSDPRRKFGKALTLGSGYGMGWMKFKAYCAAGPLGMAPMIISNSEAKAAIYGYREANPNIKESWQKCDELISVMFKAKKEVIKRDPIEIMSDMIILPNGMSLLYDRLRIDGERFVYGEYKTSLYGARLQENIVQALARIVISDQLLMMEAAGIHTVSSTHDEILAVVSEADGQATLDKMIEIMSTTPKWAKGLPLGAEGGFDKSYCK